MQLRWLSIRAASKSETTDLSPFPVIWRVLGAVVLGVVFARWSWLLFAPHATAVDVVPEHETTVATGRLFGVAELSAPSSGVAASASTILSNVHLIGVFAPRMGQPGFAVFKLDAKHQQGVAVGENLDPNTKLLGVYPNYVLLERSGAQQRVNLEEKAAALVPTPK